MRIQDYIDMRPPNNSAELYELLLKYESRHESYRVKVSRNPERKEFAVIAFILFHMSLKLREMEMVFEGIVEN